MFLLTVFLMDGPVKEEETAPSVPKPLGGHDNTMFSTADETNLPTITSLVSNHKRLGTESSRL